MRDARRGGSRRGTLSSRSTPTLFAELVARPTDGHTRASSPPTSVRATAVSPSSDPMADDGALGVPPRRGLPRAPAATTRPPPRDDPDPAASASADADGEAERRHLRRATQLDAHRDPHGPRDDEMDHLRRVLADYREENDSLGEAVLAMKSALLRASEEAERARVREIRRGARLGSRRALGVSRATRSSSARRSKRAEQLALELTDDLEAMTRARAAETSAREAAEATATTAEEETAAARAMADALRDAVTRLERDVAAKNARRRERRDGGGARGGARGGGERHAR